MTIKTAKELAKRCEEVAKNYKTLYVLGCIGAPLNAINKNRYCNNLSYNAQTLRTVKIKSASAETFGFDCVCLIKSLLWGWDGDKSAIYGGANYVANGVPDIGANQMIKVCKDVSTDFSNIQVGEAVWMDGHIGVYIGNGLAVECTPKWKDGVQITAVHNIGKKSGYNGRTWTKHGKLPYVTYEAAEAAKKPVSANKGVTPTVKEWQLAAIADGFKFPKYGANGAWGAECASVARRAIVKMRKTYKHKNLTRLVQKAVGVKVDGKCGENTDAAIRAYQEKHSLTADGAVGLNTWKKILNIR